MSEIIETSVLRTGIPVDGETASYLTVEQDGPAVLLLHGTYWSRVWLPVLDRIAEAGLRPVAVDLPGLGRSGGELTLETATVPALADWVARFASALRLCGPIAVAGHDIGGALAQHLLVHDRLEVSRLALVNSVTYDSWPVSSVARFRNPEVIAATTADEILAARRKAVTAALAGAATEQRIADYLDPWTDARVCRSWMALAGAADNRYTRDAVPALRRNATPKLLIWARTTASRRWRTPSGSPRRSRTPHSYVSRMPGTSPRRTRPTRSRARSLTSSWRSDWAVCALPSPGRRGGARRPATRPVGSTAITRSPPRDTFVGRVEVARGEPVFDEAAEAIRG